MNVQQRWRNKPQNQELLEQIARLGGQQEIMHLENAFVATEQGIKGTLERYPNLYEGDSQKVDDVVGERLEALSTLVLSHRLTKLQQQVGRVKIRGIGWVHRSLITFTVCGVLVIVPAIYFVSMIFSPKAGSMFWGLIGLVTLLVVGALMYPRVKD